METLKAFTDITQPDPRNLHFVKFDASAPDGLSPILLEDIHRAVADLELGTNVPEGNGWSCGRSIPSPNSRPAGPSRAIP